jgi:hypothetical protein
MAIWGQQEFWGNGGGAAKALATTAFTEADAGARGGTEFTVPEPADILIRLDVSVLACTRIEVRLDISPIGDFDWISLPRRVDRGTHVSNELIYDSVEGSIGSKELAIHCPGGVDARLMIRRIDGGATTAVFASGSLRYNKDGPSLIPPVSGGTGYGGAPSVTAYAEAIGDGAGAAITLTGNFQWGAWFDMGDADTLELLIDKTTANNPTNVDIAVQVSDDEVNLYDPTQIDAVAGGFESRSTNIIRVTDFDAVTPDRRSLMISAIVGPQQSFRIGARFVGGVAPDLFGRVRTIRS